VTPTLVFRKLAVPQQGFTRQVVTERCLKFLDENPAVKMARLTIVPDIQSATYSLVGCDHCKAYRFWRMLWDSTADTEFPIGEMMMIEGNAVLRYRDNDGTVSAIVLRGTDPRMIHVGDFTVLFIRFEPDHVARSDFLHGTAQF
jgi:hypothetical protein